MGDGQAARCDLLRVRLQDIERRLEIAAPESRDAGLSRIATLIVASAEQVRSLLDAAMQPPTFRVESVIARAERTLDVWTSLKAF